jgi:hypothetical protein
MTRFRTLLQLSLLGLLLYPFAAAKAQANYNAASCSESSVQAAYATEQASKADGDTITIPSCASTTWSSSWTISPTNSLTIQGATTVTGNCLSLATCATADNTTIALGNGAKLTFNVASGKVFRLTGLTINPGGSTAQYGSINFNGAGQIRMDHNHINDTISGDHTIQPDQVTGVLDHNFFDSTNNSNLFFIQPTINGADGQANTTWTVADNFGSSGFLYVENNFFQNGAFLFDCDFGGRIAFRYNTGWYNTRIQTHGTGSGAQRRGCRDMEVYNNTFTYSNSPSSNSFAFLMDYESGPLMFWGNTMTAFATILREQEVRADNATYTETATPNGFGYCGTAFNGTGSAWDQSSSSSSGGACLDQVGRGAGQLLTGSFPNLVNSSAGKIAWPNQALVPTYAWMNTQNTSNYSANHFWQTYESPARVTENQDYYLQYPNVDHAGSFTGAGGTGYGTLASRPSSCTTGVAYFATDQGSWNSSGSGGQGVLYKCTSTNAWTLAYTPYAYPHPLTKGGTQQAATPPPPTGLTAVVN